MNITIPRSVTSIGSSIIYLCISLRFIKVSTENSRYSNFYDDGILYEKSIHSICYKNPSGKVNETFKIPETVTSIETYAFKIKWEICSWVFMEFALG